MLYESPSTAGILRRLAGAPALAMLIVGTTRCELVIAPTASTEGAIAGDEMERKLGYCGVQLSCPLLPAEAEITTRCAATSNAAASGSQTALPESPHAAPLSKAPVVGGRPEEKTATSMPSS